MPEARAREHVPEPSCEDRGNPEGENPEQGIDQEYAQEEDGDEEESRGSGAAGCRAALQSGGRGPRVYPRTVCVHFSIHCSLLAPITFGSSSAGLVGTGAKDVKRSGSGVSGFAGYTHIWNGMSFWKSTDSM